MNLERHSKDIKKELPLKIFKKFSKMIENGATGFDLAFETEERQLTTRLMLNGIFFYHTFLKIGNQKFKDAPDTKKTNYQSFKLIEYTEKYIFMEWLNKIITNQDKKDSILKDYAKYVESKEYKYKGYLLCKNCGAKITDKNQKFCEECGKELI
jgi:hypothetical protein